MKTKRILCRMKPRDIKNGKIDLRGCPISECIKRTLKTKDEVYVRMDRVEVGEVAPRVFKTSIRMKRFMNKFDFQKKTKPINFYLEEVSR